MRSISTVTLITALLGLGSGVAAASTTICVNANDANDLQTQLNNAAGSTATTVIEVPRGTYDLGGGSLTFNSTAMGQGQLDISGGFSSDCSTQIKNPALTVIRGDGVTTALDLSSPAGISVRYLTIENGFGNPLGGGLIVTSVDGGIIIDYNIIRDNGGENDAGLSATLSAASATGAIHVDGNLIVNNVAESSFGAGAIENAGKGNTYITNNTIVNNTAATSGEVGGLFVSTGFNSGSVVADISNNLSWGNTSYDLGLIHSPNLVNNDYQNVSGALGSGSSDNQNIDPDFVSSNDFHLAANSPVLAQGTLTPAGGLPTIDIEGNPRSYNSAVDMGAYERDDEIFGDGYDD